MLTTRAHAVEGASVDSLGAKGQMPIVRVPPWKRQARTSILRHGRGKNTWCGRWDTLGCWSGGSVACFTVRVPSVSVGLFGGLVEVFVSDVTCVCD